MMSMFNKLKHIFLLDSSCIRRTDGPVVRNQYHSLKPVPFGVSRVDTLKYYKAKMQQQKVITLMKNYQTFKRVTYGNDVLS